MERIKATKELRELLNSQGLSDWSIRLTDHFGILGLCSYKDKCIILNYHHVDQHPEPEVLNTIRHEVAHALTPGAGHTEFWQIKARELGCTSIAPCSHLGLNPEIIDAIRSGAQVEVTFETEVIHRPKYQITRLQDKCEVCGKVAEVTREMDIPVKDETKPDRKMLFFKCGHSVTKLIPKGTPFGTLVSNWWKDEIRKCQHSFVKNQCEHCGEYRPYDFQKEGMKFLEAALSVNKGGSVFDEMGLGKTVQAVGLMRFHFETKGPFLVLTKKKAKFQWFKELLRWGGPDLLAQVLTTSNDFIIPNLKVYIASYDMFVHKVRSIKNKRTGEIKTVTQGFDINKFQGIVKTIILDECQAIKNPDAARTQEVRKLAKNCQVIGLSGTPWKNRGSEFFTILNLLAPNKFPSFEGFKKNWVDYYFDGKFTKEAGIANPKKFKEYIADIAIRREIADVAVEMPDVTRTMFYTELDNVAQNEYDAKVSDFVEWYNQAVINGEEDNFQMTGNILGKIQKMRHITGLAKIPTTIDMVEEIIEENQEKVCIFVHHKDVGEILARQLEEKYPDIPVLKFHAQMTDIESFQVSERFNKTKLCIGVLSTLAAGEAINLQTCRHAIMHERQWNPQNEDQAAPGRFRRIGANFNMVNVQFTTASGTVDEFIGNKVEKKRAWFHNTMNKGLMPEWSEKAFAKEIAEDIVNDWNKKNKKSITKMAAM